MIPEAFSETFKYKASVRYTIRENHIPGSWINLLKDELDNGRPVLYIGTDPNACHAFVCDGYQNSGYFHFNWGWSGIHDGYYYLDNLAPGEWNFSSYQGAVLGIEPEPVNPVYSYSYRALTGTEDIKVFPNPVSELLTIEFSTHGSHQLEIISLNGQQIFSEKTEGSSCQFDLSAYPSGIYFLTIRSKDATRTKKIIKL